MNHPNIPGALATGGLLLLLAYGGLWFALPGLGLVAAADAEREITYEVVTGAGAVEAITVEIDDPAAVLTEAARRFGSVESVRRLEGAEAAAKGDPLRRARAWIATALVFPLGMLWAAGRVRVREAALAKVWEALRSTLSAPIETLSSATGLNARAVTAQVERINRRGLAQLVVHPRQGWVADRRLSSQGVGVSHCAHCNEPAGLRVRADLIDVPQCPTCMNVYARSQLVAQVSPLVEQLLAMQPRPPAGAPPPFSLPLFSLLTLIMPPLAVVHALRAAG